ncbi:PEP-CTERM sorting domain-containing protein, partial [Microcoleus sp. herbarium8]|uniref:PEP-CTERM sorting domain-containing protein n=1 Tax=Microcoleus sp. herbarium8 TaxID=3055436 RepID=UPI002FD3A51A
SPRGGGRPIRAVPASSLRSTNALTLALKPLFESANKGNNNYATDYVDIASVSHELLVSPELSSTSSNSKDVNVASVSGELLENSELSSTPSSEKKIDLTDISSNLLLDSESLSTDNNENQIDLASISGDLLEDPELSSTDNNENELDLAGISGDLLEDPGLASKDSNSLASKNPDDDALPAEAVPEPTSGLGTLLALGGLGLLLKLKNRKTKE